MDFEKDKTDDLSCRQNGISNPRNSPSTHFAIYPTKLRSKCSLRPQNSHRIGIQLTPGSVSLTSECCCEYRDSLFRILLSSDAK